jgi:hypothetical protein
MIGTWTDRYEEINAARPLVSWVELYFLKEGKRSITWANLEFNPNLKVWVFSSNSGVYFLLENPMDNTGLRRFINHGNAFLVPDEEHDTKVRAGMKAIGVKYSLAEIDYHSHYLPLVETVLSLENQENLPKDERSEAVIVGLKNEIKQILER